MDVVGAKRVQAVDAADADEASMARRTDRFVAVKHSGIVATCTLVELRLGLQAHPAKASCHSALFRVA